MFKVYCMDSKKRYKWVEYSKVFDTLSEAEKCKIVAESRGNCSVNGDPLIYKIKPIN